MTFDFGDVLSHAWQITWKHRVLWIIGVIFGFFISMMFPLMLAPASLPIVMQNSRTDLMPLLIVGEVIIFLLFMLVLYPMSILVQTSLTLGIVDAEQGAEHFSVRDLLKRSLPFFWRVLGIFLLFQIAMMLIIFIVQAAMVLLAVVTFGIGIVCMMPLTLVMYPFLYGSMVWMEQAMNGVIVDNMTVMDAARQGWDLIRNNLLSISLMALVIYFGIGFITGALLMPVLVPLFIAPLSFVEHQINWTILSLSIAGALVFIPLFALLMGWSTIFSKSAWVLTYLRLTRNPQLQPLPGTVEVTI